MYCGHVVSKLNGASWIESYWQPIGSRIWEMDWYQNEWPWPLFRGRIKVMSTIALMSNISESETDRDRGLVPKDRQKVMVYGVSNGHMTDDVTWPWKVKLVTPIRLELNIPKTAGDRLHFKGPPIGNGIWSIKWSRGRWRQLTSALLQGPIPWIIARESIITSWFFKTLSS